MSDIEVHLTQNKEIAFSPLQPHVKKTIDMLALQGKDYEEIARDWLSPAGPDSVAHFGSRRRSAFFDAFKVELYNFVCGDTTYADQKNELVKKLEGLSGGPEAAQALVVSSITAAISPVLGANAILIAPAVVIMLFLIAKMSKNAWCTANKPS